jgi:hypothetical protein
MSDGHTRYALWLRFILDTPIPVSLGYRLLVTGPKFHHRDTEDTEVGSLGILRVACQGVSLPDRLSLIQACPIISNPKSYFLLPPCSLCLCGEIYLCGFGGLAGSNPVSPLRSKNSLITISTQSSRSWVFSSGVRPSSLAAGSSFPMPDEVKSSNKCLILLFSIFLRWATAHERFSVKLCALGRSSYFQNLSYLGKRGEAALCDEAYCPTTRGVVSPSLSWFSATI